MPAIVLTQVQKDSLLIAAQAEADALKAAKEVNRLTANLRTLAATVPFKDLISILRDAEKRTAATGLKAGDARYLEAAASNGDSLPSAVMQRHTDASRKCATVAPKATAASCVAWEAVLTGLRNLTGQLQDYAMLETAAARRKAIANAQLAEAYMSVGLAQLSAFAWDDKQAESDRLRIGTQYGFGNAFMSPFWRDSDNDSFNDLTLKLYRFPVDKSLPDPYFGNQSARWSMALGVVRGDLHHRGQKLSAFAGGVSPTLGVAWDLPGLRDVAVHGGWVFFRQPNTNPAASTDDTSVRMAPFLSLGFDFDAANRLSKLVTP
jgi:hypothetical protein